MAPGNNDPMVAIQLFYHQVEATKTTEVGSNGMSTLAVRADYWNTQAKSMTRGSSRPWWRKRLSSAADEMSYECDASLGNMSETDCTQMGWQLGPTSDSIAIGPGQTTFLHSSEFPKLAARDIVLIKVLSKCLVDTCFLAMSASIALVVSWAQVRIALDELLGMCVQNPLQASQGGRAFFKPPPRHIRSGRIRRGQSDLTGRSSISLLLGLLSMTTLHN